MASKAGKNFNTSAKMKAEKLPQWNFDNFYSSPDSPEFEADFKKLEAWSADFAARYEGKIASLDGDALAAAIQEAKDMGDLEGKLGTYVQLKQVQDSKKYTPAAEAFDRRSAPLQAQGAFFSHEIKQIDQATMDAMLQKSAALQKFAPWLDRVRKGIPHTPPLVVTQYSAELNADAGTIGLYDKWHAAKTFPFERKRLNQEGILHIITNDPDRDRRRRAHEVFVRELKKDSMLSAHLMNERLRLKGVDDKWENFDQPWDARHLANNVSAEMVNALVQAVKDTYKPVFQRFYELKAKLMGLSQLEIYDRNVNPFERESKYIPFEEAKNTVIEAYRSFLPEMADEAQKFFDNGWIDAAPGPYKAPGAFAHPGASRLANPMVMLNYKGSPRDVATMAHELGHGVHQAMSAFEGDAIVHSPLTFAETASVFGEMVTFKSQLAKATSDDDRRAMLFDKINDMINTLYRQISFHDFEVRMHTAFKEGGNLKEEELEKHFRDALEESYGTSIKLPDDYGAVYSYIGHFMHSPFYVYAYAFGESLVNALYQVYEEGTIPDFKEKYVELLKKGGTLTAEDLKTMFGLDITDPEFWKKGITMTEGMLDELEALCQPLLDAKSKPAAPAPSPKA